MEPDIALPGMGENGLESTLYSGIIPSNGNDPSSDPQQTMTKDVLADGTIVEKTITVYPDGSQPIEEVVTSPI